VPIHGQGYRRRGAVAAVSGFRFAPITRLAVRQVAMRRMLILLLAVSFAPILIAGGLLVFVLARFPDFAALAPPLPELFGLGLLVLQGPFAILVTVWGGTALVADDFRTGALLVYFSRPLTRLDYVAGKLAVVVALNLAVTAVPLLLLWLMAAALHASEMGKHGLSFLPVAIVALSAGISVALALLALAAGAVTRNATVGGSLLVGALVLFELAALAAPDGVRLFFQVLSVIGHIRSLEHALFGAPWSSSMHWASALACLTAILAGAGVVLWRKLQAVEVV
jgi:ABC-2 type transport system permease protein